MALRRRGGEPTPTEAARARLRDALHVSDGWQLPKGPSSCALCGVRTGKGALVRHEERTLDSRETPPLGWSEVRRMRAGEPGQDVWDVTWRRSWRLCALHKAAHDHPEHEWGALAVLLVAGVGPPFEPGQVVDAGTVARELGPMVYKWLPASRPADRGASDPWRHVDVEKVRERFAGLTAARAFAAEHGTTSPTGAPCFVCGTTHCEQWGRAPRPEPGARPRPADLAVCDVCAFEWLRRHEDTHGAIPSSLSDWAASEAAGSVATIEGLAARVGFVLASRHPAFRDVEAGAFRAPWAYLGADDLDALAGHVAGRRVPPRADGRLRIPQGVSS